MQLLRKLKEVADLIPAGVILMDSSREIIYMNGKAEDITGYKSSELEGEDCQHLFGNNCCNVDNDCFLNNKEEEVVKQCNLIDSSHERVEISKYSKSVCKPDGTVIGGVEILIPISSINKRYVELKRGFEIIEKKLSQSRELLDVGLFITSSISLHRIMLRLINTLRDNFNYEIVTIAMANERGELEIMARAGRYSDDFDQFKIVKPGKGIVGKCFESKEPIIVTDVSKNADYIAVNPEIRSELAVPIIYQNRILGVINAESTQLHYFTQEDVSILTNISNFAAAAISNAELTKEIKLAKDQYETLFNKSSDPIFITNMKNSRFIDCNTKAVEIYGYSKEEFLKMSPADLLCPGQEDSNPVQAFRGNWDGIHLKKDKSHMYVDSHSTGIDYGNKKAYLTIVRDITKRKQLEEELKKLSITDDLTDLYNRRHFYESLKNEIERSSRYHHTLSMLMLDIDGFKSYNDQHGHQEGDKLLISLGKILKDSIRASDIPCRYGGDEFTVILPHIEGEEAYSTAQRIQNAFGELDYDNINLSIGIATYTRGESLEQFVQDADRALYYVKQKLGKGRIYVYDREKDEDVIKPAD